MPYRTIPFETGYYYHIYNRGLGKQNIFKTPKNYLRFIKTFSYYQIKNPKPKFSLFSQSALSRVDPSKKIVEVCCYCLMPNHFHLLVKQIEDGGISEFTRKFIHSYTKYWNIRYKTQGPLLQPMFKAVLVESDEQLLHLSRYIHLNPLVSGLTTDLNFYSWSSYPAYLGLTQDAAISTNEILNFFKSLKDYEKFVLNQADYGTTLELIKHSALDIGYKPGL